MWVTAAFLSRWAVPAQGGFYEQPRALPHAASPVARAVACIDGRCVHFLWPSSLQIPAIDDMDAQLRALRQNSGMLETTLLTR